MIVSQRQSSDQVEALSWLHRELAWESVLARLREQAGVASGSPAEATGEERDAA